METYQRAIAAGALAEGSTWAMEIGGWPVLLARSGGAVRAVINRCTHAESALAGGRIRRGAIICPAHGAMFNLQTGACIGSAGYPPLKVFPTRMVEGWIEVAVPDGADNAR